MPIKNILVPTDFSAGSDQAISYAYELALVLGATLHVMHVLENPFAPGAFMEMYAPPPPDYFLNIESQADKKLRNALTREQLEQIDVVLTTRLGVPAAEILNRLNEEPRIDLVVMATHGRGGVARMMMGSVTEKIVRSSPCPVLTLREDPRPRRRVERRKVLAAGILAAGI